MSFTIYPAIDILNGKCVRLLQGDYEKGTVYGNSPFEMAKRFVEDGAEWIHVVDLDGAKTGKRVNHQHVAQVTSKLPVKVQVGGGIRTESDIEYYLQKGAARIILGSAAISNPPFVEAMLKKYGEQIAIGIDAKDGYVSIEGWIKTSQLKAIDLAKELVEKGAKTFIFTDIQTDGMLSGPNVEAVLEMARETKASIIASGGVSSLEDLKRLNALRLEGVSGVIVGKAIYTKRVRLKEALMEVAAS